MNKYVKMFLVILLFAVTVASLLGCRRPSPRNPALVVLPGSTNVHWSQDNEAVAYKINEAYPAKNTLKSIYAHLEKQGWKPLKEDFLNPGIPTSDVRGWTEFVDGTSTPDQWVRQWGTDWTNAKGDVVVVFLRYYSPIDNQQQMGMLEVHARYMSAELAKSMKKFVLKEQKKDKAR